MNPLSLEALQVTLCPQTVFYSLIRLSETTQITQPQIPLHKHRSTLSRDSTMIPITHLQVPVHYTHLMAVKHRLQDLLDAVTACKHQGGRMLV